MGRQDNVDWKKLVSDGSRDVAELQEELRIPPEQLEDLAKVQGTYPFFANPYYLSLIDPDDPADPIRRMSVPNLEELDHVGLADTSGEAASTVLPGLQHKYAETALLIATSNCALYCRHCFRRRFVGKSRDEVVRDLGAVADYIGKHREITNVLVTGGDPFTLDNCEIRRYLEALAPIEHLRAIRFGTRVPVVLPQRIAHDDELVEMLAEFNARKQIHVVTQFNHAAEITPESRSAVKRLFQAGIPVRNQTVLLAGVNDDAQTLANLMNGLISAGVFPYYVFQCRPVAGVEARFQVPLRRGFEIVDEARGNLNGMGKSFRFVMSHNAGKIEILGPVEELVSQGNGEEGRMLFRFHQARNRQNLGKLFAVPASEGKCWLDQDDLP